jgi:hypothetical protein
MWTTSLPARVWRGGAEGSARTGTRSARRSPGGLATGLGAYDAIVAGAFERRQQMLAQLVCLDEKAEQMLVVERDPT